MINEILNLTKLECVNLFGFNTFRYTKDKKQRNRYFLLACIWFFLLLIIMVYTSGLVFGLVQLGLSNLVIPYLTFIVSLVIFIFNLFRSSSVIFASSGYDFICSLPISKASIVWSRFLHLYMENLGFTLVIMLPGSMMYAFLVDTSLLFYLNVVICILLMPLFPLVVSSAIGCFITSIAVKMKHKTLVETGLSVLAILVIFISMFFLEQLPAEFSRDMLTRLATSISQFIGVLYPLAIWVKKAVVYGKVSYLLLFALVSLGLSGLFVWMVSKHFHKISQRLFATSASHNYKMQKVTQKKSLLALFFREWKRYLASSIYVTNTVVGPMMALFAVIAMVMVGLDSVLVVVPDYMDVVELLPYAVVSMMIMMPTTAVSISMEGKQIWIVKSLPVSTKQVLDSKMLLNLSLLLPFYVMTEIVLFYLIGPNLWQSLELLFVPIIFIIFTVIFGITVDLKFHRFDWSKEEVVVKQSASTLLGGFGGTLLTFLCMVLLVLVPIGFKGITKVLMGIVILVISFVLYHKNYQRSMAEW